LALQQKAREKPDFKITPPSPTLGGVSIKTGDEVSLKFAWRVARAGIGQAAR
jgi:hypothetical protein